MIPPTWRIFLFLLCPNPFFIYAMDGDGRFPAFKDPLNSSGKATGSRNLIMPQSNDSDYPVAERTNPPTFPDITDGIKQTSETMLAFTWNHILNQMADEDGGVVEVLNGMSAAMRNDYTLETVVNLANWLLHKGVTAEQQLETMMDEPLAYLAQQLNEEQEREFLELGTLKQLEYLHTVLQMQIEEEQRLENEENNLQQQRELAHLDVEMMAVDRKRAQSEQLYQSPLPSPSHHALSLPRFPKSTDSLASLTSSQLAKRMAHHGTSPLPAHHLLSGGVLPFTASADMHPSSVVESFPSPSAAAMAKKSSPSSEASKTAASTAAANFATFPSPASVHSIPHSQESLNSKILAKNDPINNFTSPATSVPAHIQSPLQHLPQSHDESALDKWLENDVERVFGPNSASAVGAFPQLTHTGAPSSEFPAMPRSSSSVALSTTTNKHAQLVPPIPPNSAPSIKKSPPSLGSYTSSTLRRTQKKNSAEATNIVKEASSTTTIKLDQKMSAAHNVVCNFHHHGMGDTSCNRSEHYHAAHKTASPADDEMVDGKTASLISSEASLELRNSFGLGEGAIPPITASTFPNPSTALGPSVESLTKSENQFAHLLDKKQNSLKTKEMGEAGAFPVISPSTQHFLKSSTHSISQEIGGIRGEGKGTFPAFLPSSKGSIHSMKATKHALLQEGRTAPSLASSEASLSHSSGREDGGVFPPVPSITLVHLPPPNTSAFKSMPSFPSPSPTKSSSNLPPLFPLLPPTSPSPSSKHSLPSSSLGSISSAKLSKKAHDQNKMSLVIRNEPKLPSSSSSFAAPFPAMQQSTLVGEMELLKSEKFQSLSDENKQIVLRKFQEKKNKRDESSSSGNFSSPASSLPKIHGIEQQRQKEFMTLHGGSSNNIEQSSRRSNDNDGTEEAIGRSSSFAHLPSFPHISAQFKNKKGGLLEKPKNYAVHLTNLHTAMSSKQILEEVGMAIGQHANEAAKARFELEQKLGQNNCVNGVNYRRHRNILIKSLMFQTIFLQIYPELKRKQEKAESDIEQLKTKIGSYKKIMDKISKGELQPLSAEQHAQYKGTLQNFKLLDIRRNILADSLAAMKRDRSHIYDDTHLDELLIRILLRQEKPIEAEVEMTTYKEYVRRNYKNWRLDFTQIALEKIDVELGRLRGNKAAMAAAFPSFSELDGPNSGEMANPQ